MFIDWYLPGYRAGGPIRALANLVQRLDDQFYIVTRDTDHHSSEPYEGIAAGKWTRLASNVQVMYCHEAEVGLRFCRDLIRQLDCNRIYLNSMYSPRFTLLPLLAAACEGRLAQCILVPHGMLAPGSLSAKSWRKRAFLRLARWSGWFNRIRWHATSENERTEILRWFPGVRDIRVAPNLAAASGSKPLRPEKRVGELRLLILARISPEKGILEALQFLEHAQLRAEVVCQVHGVHQNTAYLEECRALCARMSGVRAIIGNEVEPGEVPELRSRYHFLYLPTRGENYGYAIVEALANATPVIISDRTPWRNLAAQAAGWDLPLEPEAFARVLRHCVAMDQAEYARLCAGAFALGQRIAADPAAIRASAAIFD